MRKNPKGQECHVLQKKALTCSEHKKKNENIDKPLDKPLMHLGIKNCMRAYFGKAHFLPMWLNAEQMCNCKRYLMRCSYLVLESIFNLTVQS